MGIWRFKMVLLSTLAALVIIVHSAEEEYAAQYRRELRPRMLDTGTPRSYDQSWRTMDLEPVMQQSTPDETWTDGSSEEPPRRRRPGRKRKRRPETSSPEEVLPIELYSFPEDSARSYIDLDPGVNRKAPDTPKKRRKKIEPMPERWVSTLPEERPVRRRGQRRKRPSVVESWPVFSEFNDYHPNAPNGQTDEHVTTSLPDTEALDDDYRRSYDHRVGIVESRKPALDKARIKSGDIYIKRDDDHKLAEFEKNADDGTNPRPQHTVNAEFTFEDIASAHGLNIENEKYITNIKDRNIENRKKSRDKVKEKLIAHFSELKARGEGPIDPLTLKDILKKSNGTSLSEILQQHNLSLTDLLHGREKVLSILKSTDSDVPDEEITEDKPTNDSDIEEKSSEERFLIDSETKYAIDLTTEEPIQAQTVENFEADITTEVKVELVSTEKPKLQEVPKRANIRRYPPAIRRKQRIKPMLNTTYKSQLSRDMIALNAQKYFNNRRRNSTHEWKELLPMIKKKTNNTNPIKTEMETTTISSLIEDTTMAQEQDVENCTKSAGTQNEHIDRNEDIDEPDKINKKTKTDTDKEEDIFQPKATDKFENIVNVTVRPALIQTSTQTVNVSGLRRQAFNNRLKKKRLKQKNLTTESPQDDIMINLYGMPNLVSSSEFISQTQSPKTSLDDVTILEDFLTTEMPHKQVIRGKNTKFTSPMLATTTPFVFIPSSTEETAKLEIEEIFNDTRTSARLSKILKERNMTFDELVEHRERGSSHVHLADIFHNASKEPNPPEPFLSKSLIEPISKETYPLRALLDANIHDTTAKATTIDLAMQTTEINIPVVMDFGNNVNENAENMGIMSLFHNITKNNTNGDKKTLKKDSHGTLYETSITIVNTTDGLNLNDALRESRVIHMVDDKKDDKRDDIVTWNEIFSLMRSNYDNNQTEVDKKSTTIGAIPSDKISKPSLEKDLDGDGVIVLEDLQHLKDFDSSVASNENIDFNAYERPEIPSTKRPTILEAIPNQTKSVTVAAASIAGLAMVLFLLTYAGYKWQQHRSIVRKKNYADERVPSPVFENRKGHKNNSSNRSISPMLSSNIYTLNTLDSRNGKDSPDYMWDSLRKPFQ